MMCNRLAHCRTTAENKRGTPPAHAAVIQARDSVMCCLYSFHTCLYSLRQDCDRIRCEAVCLRHTTIDANVCFKSIACVAHEPLWIIIPYCDLPIVERHPKRSASCGSQKDVPESESSKGIIPVWALLYWDSV